MAAYQTLPSPGASVIEGSFLGNCVLLRPGIERDRLADPQEALAFCLYNLKHLNDVGVGDFLD